MRTILLAASALTFLGLASAQASTITMETGYSKDGQQGSAAAYKSAVEAAMQNPAGPGYGTTNPTDYDNLSNRGTLGGYSNDIAFRFTVDFNVAAGETGKWDFRLGTDFGRGGAVFLDGVALTFKTNDMWWGGNWGNTSGTFEQTVLNLGAGNHTLVVYGLEGCCDGGQSGQFQVKNGGWTTFSTNDGHNPAFGAAVPEPASMALLGAGLFGLGAIRRRRNRAG